MANDGTLFEVCAHYARQLGVVIPERFSSCDATYSRVEWMGLLIGACLISELNALRRAVEALDPCPDRKDNLDLDNPPL